MHIYSYFFAPAPPRQNYVVFATVFWPESRIAPMKTCRFNVAFRNLHVLIGNQRLEPDVSLCNMRKEGLPCAVDHHRCLVPDASRYLVPDASRYLVPAPLDAEKLLKQPQPFPPICFRSFDRIILLQIRHLPMASVRSLQRNLVRTLRGIFSCYHTDKS